jgi:hypothetical protein
MSDLEPNDPIWNVLGQAKVVDPSPFFARNVVREARRLEGDRSGLWNRVAALFSGPRAVFATASCALLAMVLMELHATTRAPVSSAAKRNVVALATIGATHRIRVGRNALN